MKRQAAKKDSCSLIFNPPWPHVQMIDDKGSKIIVHYVVSLFLEVQDSPVINIHLDWCRTYYCCKYVYYNSVCLAGLFSVIAGKSE